MTFRQTNEENEKTERARERDVAVHKVHNIQFQRPESSEEEEGKKINVNNEYSEQWKFT